MDANYQKLIRLADTLSMREMDRHALEDLGIQGLVLMENAARSVADWLTDSKLKKDPDFTIVGYVADSSEENSFIANDGSSHKLIAQGWDSTKD